MVSIWVLISLSRLPKEKAVGNRTCLPDLCSPVLRDIHSSKSKLINNIKRKDLIVKQETEAFPGILLFNKIQKLVRAIRYAHYSTKTYRKQGQTLSWSEGLRKLMGKVLKCICLKSKLFSNSNAFLQELLFAQLQAIKPICGSHYSKEPKTTSSVLPLKEETLRFHQEEKKKD